MAENEIIVEQPKQTFSMALTDSLNEVKEALPADFNIQRFVQNGVALLNDNQVLKDYAKQFGTNNIKLGMMKAAYLGLDFMNKEAYLIPYGPSLQFMKDYRGDKKLAMRYSKRPIKDIYAKLVRKGDEFSEEVDGTEQKVVFKPIPFNDEPVVGAFAVCLYADGGMMYETMSRKELDRIRNCSKQKNGPTWTQHEGEMQKKTVLHRLCKHISIDFDTPMQRELWEEDMQIDTDQKPKKASLNEMLAD